MAKNKKRQQQTFLSPEKYIRQKARSLKIKACYITDDYEEYGMGQIIVAREHSGGRVTMGVYLIDKLCLGVKDTFYRFRMDDYEFEELLDRMDDIGFREISYEEAHNRIFGAIEFAEVAGIDPHKDFAVTQYILEEDTDDIPLIEYEYGKDGMHYLMAENNLEASRYLPLLKKNLGDSFDYTIKAGNIYDDDYDEEEDEGDDRGGLMTPSEFAEPLRNHPMFKEYGPETEYTYKHPEYPKEVTLENPVVEEILCDPRNALYLTREQIDTLLALPHDSLRRDLKNLILYHIGIGCDGIPEEVSHADFVGVIGNAVILLAESGSPDSSLDVVLEVLRQSEKFFQYHIGDISTETFVPTIYKLGHERLDRLMAFMEEEGLYDFAKINVPAAVALIAQEHPERRAEVLEWFRRLLLLATEKISETQAIDSIVAGFIIDNLSDIKANELLPEIEALFGTGLVDEGICGNINEARKNLNGEISLFTRVLPTDIYERFDKIKKQVQL